ncbi:MAG: hypothetical protein N2114_06750, partial [Candidatus Goldbacteria bacterium]|nr:hypothetical protein [Candidatus Goldiibacteriota bacterium]
IGYRLPIVDYSVEVRRIRKGLDRKDIKPLRGKWVVNGDIARMEGDGAYLKYIDNKVYLVRKEGRIKKTKYIGIIQT